MLLDAAHEGHRHARQMMHVFSVCFLGPAPAWVAQIVDGRGEQHVATGGPEFAAHGCTHALFEPGIPGSAPGDTHRKRRRALYCSDAPRTIRHLERRQSQPLYSGHRPELLALGTEDRALPRHLGDLFLQCHPGDKICD